jgi:pSer/pThr/pTyr-binding forkhead associated (FHA) protein
MGFHRLGGRLTLIAMRRARETITERLLAPRIRYGSGPLTGLLVLPERRVHAFDALETPEVTIGRLRTCDIQLGDAAVSRLHCVIERQQDGTCYIVDEQSTNGVYINDVQVIRAELRPGMWIHLGRTELIAMGTGGQLPIAGRSYTSFLVNARDVHGTAESAAGVVHRSAATIYRALQRLRRRVKG